MSRAFAWLRARLRRPEAPPERPWYALREEDRRRLKTPAPWLDNASRDVPRGYTIRRERW